MQAAIQVGVVMGSNSDWDTMQHAVAILQQFGIAFEAQVVSAHRMPDDMFRYAEAAAERGLKAIIAGAGGAAHLPGMIAAKTPVPVLGVPVASRHLQGVDSLHSSVQMPKGVPVATFAIGQAGSSLASSATANSAALAAPAVPMANVATGMPLGICTMLCSESTPERCLLATGLPSTGTVVLAANMPGRWAAPPAPAMMARRPRPTAASA